MCPGVRVIDPELVEQLWQQIEPIVFISRQQFERGLAEWDVTAIVVEEKLAFVTLTQGPEFHYTSFDTGTPITLALIRGWLEPILAKYGYATTRTPKSEPRQHRLNLRLGCTVCDEDEFFIHYRLEAPPCQ